MNRSIVFTLPLLATAILLASPAQANSPAFNRAEVLGRANGGAIACSATPEKRAKFAELALTAIEALAVDFSDKSDATTRFAIATARGRRAVEGGSIGCGDALWFWEDQFKGLQPKRKARR